MGAEVTLEIAMAEQETHSAFQKFGVSFLESVKKMKRKKINTCIIQECIKLIKSVFIVRKMFHFK